MPRMTIGELARSAGVGVETVRYYQRRGLFPEPPRQPRSTREYAPDALELLRFIRRARGLGFTIKEIERLLALRRSRKDARDLVALLTGKASELEREVRELHAAIHVLREMAAKCEALSPTERWRLFDTDD
ncbi:MAG: MerR family transcriptional regulator [Labilithrix sp.]|nr:MerR family transcriptional regulator [Labilithrix sp.]